MVVQCAFLADGKVTAQTEVLQRLSTMLQAIALLLISRLDRRFNFEFFDAVTFKAVHVSVSRLAMNAQVLSTIDTVG